jgi:Protein kinase domain
MEEAHQSTSHTSAPPAPGGKEELRTTLLKPYVLRLRSERGEAAARALLAKVGLPEGVLFDETAWVSVAAATRALGALAAALGEDAIKRHGEWATHPEALGAYVRMLRVASAPGDAYQYLCAHAAESTRVGRYEFVSLGDNRARISYTPRAESESPCDDRLLCLARAAELVALPRLWGLADAQLEEAECLAKGGSACRYELTWPAISGRRNIPLGALAGALGSGGAVALYGDLRAAAVAAGVGAVLGGAVGLLLDRIASERAARVLERHRITALERGLELRGDLAMVPGELTGVVLGGKYRIKQRIGSGGIGTVYAAEHVALGSHVAVKVLRGAAAADAAEVARLRREARVQVFVEHPNVVKMHDLDQMPDGSIYVVMELLHGLTLGNWLRSLGVLTPAVAARTFVEVCRALDAAHRFGIVHRDLKPGNIFLCDDGAVKVLDFGMSKLAEAESLTQQGFTLGTPEYMSPEQCVGSSLDGRSDLYSLGVVMYEALTASLPFRAANRRELLRMHQQSKPRSMRELRPELGLPAALDAAVLACLAKSPADRPESAAVLERMLMPLANRDRLDGSANA